MDIKVLQDKIENWSTSRFPSAPSYLALIKVMEELGELAGHFIGRLEQRVGKAPVDHQAGVEDSVADVLIALSVFCVREKLDLSRLTDQVWNEVSQRTFVIKKEQA